LQIVFLTYINRSGSTYLVNQLSKLKDFLIIPEGEILVKELLFNADKKPDKNTLNAIIQDHKVKHWNWDTSNIKDYLTELTNAELFFRLLELYREFNGPQSKILVFKAWELIYTLGKIPLNLMSKYRLTYFALYRDVRAIVSSQKLTIYKNKPIDSNTVRATMKWRNFMRICQANDSLITLLQYEEMINDFNVFFRFFFNKFEIVCEPTFRVRSGSITESLPDDQKLLHPHIDLKPQPDFIEKWKDQLPEEEITIIQKLTCKELSDFGYDILPVKAHSGKLVFKWIKYYFGIFAISIIHIAD